MLDRGVYLPPSAYEAWFLSAAHDDRAVQTVLDALPARRPRGGRRDSEGDHDEPDRPTRSSTCCATARCTTPRACSTAAATASTSPTLGQQMAQRVADTIGDRDITHMRRLAARAGAGDRAAAGGRPRPRHRHRPPGDRVDERVRGQALRRRRRRRCASPVAWRHLWNPFRPSWGEPYKEIAARMMAAVHDARDAAARPRGRDRLPPAADLDHPAARRRSARSSTTRASGSARSARSPRCTSSATGSPRCPTPSPPAT